MNLNGNSSSRESLDISVGVASSVVLHGGFHLLLNSQEDVHDPACIVAYRAIRLVTAVEAGYQQ